MARRDPIEDAALLTRTLPRGICGGTPTGRASRNAPLASVACDTLNAASPAVDVTVAVVDAVYSFSTPGVNGPNDAGGPTVRASVGGTVPPTSTGTAGVTRTEPLSLDGVRNSWPRYSA